MKHIQVKLRLLLLLLTALITFSSCQKDDTESEARLTETDFMTRAANSNLFEIQTGQIASSKGNLPEVRELALQLVTEHSLASNELKILAMQKKIAVSDSLSEDKRPIRNRLSGENGPTFDKDFVDVQITAHDEAIKLYEQATRELQDPDIRNFATKTLPTLLQHREHAAQVKLLTDAL